MTNQLISVLMALPHVAVGVLSFVIVTFNEALVGFLGIQGYLLKIKGIRDIL